MMKLVMKENELLARHSVFKIGGPARFFVDVSSPDELAGAIDFANDHKMPWIVLGAGSNVLISDAGFPGVVIHPAGGRVTVSGTDVEIEAGVSMARAVAETIKAGLGGFEWACGVPGTIGGSIRGNAGCYGSEMKDVVASIEVFDSRSGRLEKWSRSEAAFGYRDSALKRRPELVVVSVVVRLWRGGNKESQKLVRDYMARRSESQDIGSQSVGCIFKNIPWTRRDLNQEKLLDCFPEFRPFAVLPAIPAGFLIDRVGLKGRGVGQAVISERHANFIVNRGGALAEDVIILVGLIKEYVHRNFGLRLEEEIQYVGFGR